MRNLPMKHGVLIQGAPPVMLDPSALAAQQGVVLECRVLACQPFPGNLP